MNFHFLFVALWLEFDEPDDLCEMSLRKGTPRKQTKLEWSFARVVAASADSSELAAPAPAEDEHKWATSPPPFKKLRSALSPTQWKAFETSLEEQRQRNVRDAEEIVATSVGNCFPCYKTGCVRVHIASIIKS